MKRTNRKLKADGGNKPWRASVPLGPPPPPPPPPPRTCRHGLPSWIDPDGNETDRCSAYCGSQEPARREARAALAAVGMVAGNGAQVARRVANILRNRRAG